MLKDLVRSTDKYKIATDIPSDETTETNDVQVTSGNSDVTNRMTKQAKLKEKKCQVAAQAHLLQLTYSMVQIRLEKLTGLQLVKKFPAFYGTRRFITALTSVRHLSLSLASPI